MAKMTLKEAADLLERAGVDNPRGDARRIFEELGKIPPHRLVSPLATCDSEEAISAILRRAEREPLQYIIGRVDFYRESYRVTSDCLIPRPDTELLVDFAVNNLPEGARFLDLCTGSGCVAVSTLKNTDRTEAVALDISEAALTLAKENAEKNGVAERISFIRADALGAAVTGDFFAVLANPPYVSDESYATLEKEIYFEPREAFLGGADGADFYRRLTELYRDRIPPHGFIAYEIGYDQSEIIKDIAVKNGLSAEIIKDYSGNPRVAVLRRG